MKRTARFLGPLVGLAAIISSSQVAAAPSRSTSTVGMRTCKKDESPIIIVNGARVQVCRGDYEVSKGEMQAIGGIIAAVYGNPEAKIAKCEASNQAARRNFEAEMPSVIEKITELSEGLYKIGQANLIISEARNGKWDKIQEIKSLDGSIKSEVKLYFEYSENNSPANIANNGIVKTFQITSRLNIKQVKNARYLSRTLYPQYDNRDNSWQDGLLPDPAQGTPVSYSEPCNNYSEVNQSRLLMILHINKYADNSTRISRIYGPPIGDEAISVFQKYVVNKDPYKGLFSNSLNCPDNRLFDSEECKIGWYLSENRASFDLNGAAEQATANGPLIKSTGKGYLGISIAPVGEDLADALGLEKNRGEFVARVVAGEGADKAGLKEGDVILRVNDRPVTPETTVSSIVTSITPGTQIPLYILRQGKLLNLTATVGKRPAE